jgi:NAD(P)H-hydrate epimerase
MRPLSRDEARELDRRATDEFAVPGVVLMENAGRGMAELLLSLGVRGTVVVACGKGNNGGDGLVIARHLDIAGVPVHVVLFDDPESATGDAAINRAIVARTRIPRTVLAGASFDEARWGDILRGADWVVDALFGSGLRGPVRSPYDRVIEAINASGARVFAVDIPSGLDADTGSALGPTVRATHTATVVAPKIGFDSPGAAAWLGRVHVVGMGVPRELLESAGPAPVRGID